MSAEIAKQGNIAKLPVPAFIFEVVAVKGFGTPEIFLPSGVKRLLDQHDY